MMAAFSSWSKKHPVISFYVLAFLFTWLAWMPQAAHSRGLFPFDHFLFYFAGGVGPLLGAYLVLRSLYGKEAAVPKLFAPLLRWQARPVWYVVALLGIFALQLPALWLSGRRGVELWTVQPSWNLLWSFLVYLAAAIPEELAWRGFALPRIQIRYSALTSSLIVGLLWALWHLPLLWNLDNIMSTYPLAPFVVETLAKAVLYTWLYNSTRGSVLILVLFHAASNTVALFSGWVSALVTSAVALGIVWICGSGTLSPAGKVTLTDARRPLTRIHSL